MQPYAMMVPLYPPRTSCTTGATAARYRSAWLAAAPSTVSKANELHAISALLRQHEARAPKVRLAYRQPCWPFQIALILLILSDAHTPSSRSMSNAKAMRWVTSTGMSV